MPHTLGDLGEREIVRTILPKFCSKVGDDCAIFNFSGSELIITTDPVPEPAAKLLGRDPDPYWMGWLLVVINASDLAAAGASPVTFLSAIEAPSILPVREFERFLLGIADACEAERLVYSGGNLREGNKLVAVGTAVGRCEQSKALRRRGARAGDVIVSVGTGGIFWRDALKIRRSGSLANKNASPVFRPRSQLRAMELLAQERLVVAAIDNSDGLLPTLAQLGSANSLGVRLDLERLLAPEGTANLGIDPARLWLGWGDWNVIAAVRQDAMEKAKTIAAKVETVLVEIGELVTGPSQVVLARGGETQIAPRVESERFAADSWFSQGIEGYISLLLDIGLPGAKPPEKVS